MSDRRVLFAVLCAAVLLRVASSALVSPAAFLEIDGSDYLDIARHVAAGHGFAVSAPRWFEPAALLPPGPHADFARPPLLPLLGAGLLHLPGPWEWWARAVMVALGVLAAWLVARAGTALFDRRTGLCAAGILAVQPYALHYSARWSTEMPFLVLVLGAVTVLAEADRMTGAADRRRLALAGLLAGLAVLARPTGLALLPVFAAWAARGAWRAAPPPQRQRRAPFGRAGIFLLAAGLVLAPWTIRNHHATGRWNPGTFFPGYNCWLGMNDRVLAMYRAAGTPRFAAELDTLGHADSRAMVRRMEARGIVGPVAEDRYWSAAARAWIAVHPGRALEVAGRRAAHFFRISPEQSVVSTAVRLASLFLWPVHLLALGTIIRRHGRVPWILLAVPGAGLLAGLPFVFSLRYRLPFLDPYAAILAAAALTFLWDRARVSRGRRAGRAAAAP